LATLGLALLLDSPAGLAQSTASPPVLGQTPPASSGEETFPLELRRSPQFWDAAQDLTQTQLHLSDRIDRAISGTDPNAVRAAAGQILLHVRGLERFLKTQVPDPRSLCFPQFPQPARNPFSPSEQDVYCDLYGSIGDLENLLGLLNYRLGTLATVAEVRPLPLVSGEWVVTAAGIPEFQRGSLREAAPSLTRTAPVLPPVVSRPFDRPAKSALGDYQPPLDPAIAPLATAQSQLAQLNDRLGQLIARFPQGGSRNFVDPRPLSRPQVPSFSLTPEETSAEAAFLALPHTGLSRLLPASVYQENPQVVRNRLDPTARDRYPFPALVPGDAPQLPPLGATAKATPGMTDRSGTLSPGTRTLALGDQPFAAQLKLQTQPQGSGDVLELVTPDLDYGFIWDLGVVPLEQLTLDVLLNLPQDPDDDPEPAIPLTLTDLSTLTFFLTYTPPNTLGALQADRNRFLTGKQSAFGLPADLPLQAAMNLNHTYLLRSIQFQVPEALRAGRFQREGDRRYQSVLLDMPSQDLLLAVQPTQRHPDGSYTLRWRILGQFPNPEVVDLGQYVE